MTYQAVNITLPEGCSSSFVHWFPVEYSQEYSPTYLNMDSNVEVWCLVAYHYSPVGGHMGKLRHITTLQATVRLQGYPQANLPLHPGKLHSQSEVEG